MSARGLVLSLPLAASLAGQLPGQPPDARLLSSGRTRIELRLSELDADLDGWGVPLGIGRGLAVAYLRQLGFEPTESLKLIGGLADLARQTELVAIEVSGSQHAGRDVEITVHPTAGSRLEKTIAALEPSPAGAPALRLPGSTAGVAVSLSPASWAAVTEPLLALWARRRSRDPAEVTRTRELLRGLAALHDGTMALSYNADTGAFAAVLGVTDEERLRRRLREPVVARALHRRALDGVFAAGSLSAGDALAGGYRVIEAEATLEPRVDRLQRVTLPGGALLHAELWPAESLRRLGELIGVDLDRSVQRVVLTIDRHERALRLHARVW